jgi:nitroreductase
MAVMQHPEPHDADHEQFGGLKVRDRRVGRVYRQRAGQKHNVSNRSEHTVSATSCKCKSFAIILGAPKLKEEWMDGNGTIEKAIRRPQALESLLSRRSVGQLCEPAPEGDDLAHIIEAGLQAPDHGRLRPWRFVTIRGAARTTFAEMLVATFMRRDRGATVAMEERIRSRILGVPLIIAVGARIKTEGPIPEIEQLLSAGAAAANMLNAIHALGYGGMWVTGAHTYDRSVNEALGFVWPDRLVGLVYIGTPKALPPVWARPVPSDHVREWAPPSGAAAGS